MKKWLTKKTIGSSSALALVAAVATYFNLDNLTPAQSPAQIEFSKEAKTLFVKFNQNNYVVERRKFFRTNDAVCHVFELSAVEMLQNPIMSVIVAGADDDQIVIVDQFWYQIGERRREDKKTIWELRPPVLP